MSIKTKTSKPKKKVLVGMSGGVDSSVAACLLLERGYEVIGVHMRYWADGGLKDKSGPSNRCCTVDSAVKAVYVCRKLKIPLIFLDAKDAFKKKVVDRYLAVTEAGKTPNPCVECNRDIKFGLFLDRMKEMKADFVATGHYARIRKRGANRKAVFEVLRGVDTAKDQSYFLYTLTQAKLKHVLFPVGNLLKKDVRSLAAKFGIAEINGQKESQNLCFIPEGSGERFLSGHLKAGAMRSGPIIDRDGKTLGRHAGLPLYTIGQRKGICVGGGPALYVTGKDSRRNALIVGGEEDLCRKSAKIGRLSFVSGGRPSGSKLRGLKAKIRYGHEAVPAQLKFPKGSAGKNAEVIFKSPQRAVTPGQSVVFYRGRMMLGGGVIL